MADMDGNPYNDNDTVGDAFTVDSTFDHPVARMGDMVPGMPFNNAPDCAYGGFGTGGETIQKDGTTTTRFKSQGGSSGLAGVDGGTP